MRKLAIALAILVVVGGFGTYLALQLQQHATECDSALRHCAVPREEIAFLEGEWCLESDPASLRESVRFEDERILVRQSGARVGGERPWVEARIFRSMGVLVYFEHDVETGERLSSELTLLRTGETTRQTALGPNRVSWARC
ncbi:hypothetical protein [Salinarimonas ramus]|uniref:Uncharacterized protein n=1 Tax=Salinarimonas ramus TaxID=690164 RepID=A0A917QHY4_9HYPH|nr:hypothetical protein [Salinarimonas ramus]GGK49841.1 hypothetical protein GCM10011322_41060 [Salinarimonas ramus]